MQPRFVVAIVLLVAAAGFGFGSWASVRHAMNSRPAPPKVRTDPKTGAPLMIDSDAYFRDAILGPLVRPMWLFGAAAVCANCGLEVLAPRRRRRRHR